MWAGEGVALARAGFVASHHLVVWGVAEGGQLGLVGCVWLGGGAMTACA